MKRIQLFISLLLASVALFLTQQATAQAPQRMSYQSVLRNSSNVLLVNTQVGIKISVLQGSANGTAVYEETQTATTNGNGLVSIQIGTGTDTTGTFAGVDWSAGPYFIKTETDPAGGTNYTITGTQEMLSVPYALYAAKSGGTVFETTADDANAIHNTNTGNVGIGTDLPSEKLDVSGNLRVRQNEIVQGNSTVQGNSIVGQNLEVNGLAYLNALTIPTGNPAQGKVLTSDNNGIATWQAPVAPDLSGYATTTDLNITAAQLAVQNNIQSVQINDLNTGLANTNAQVQNLDVQNEVQSSQIATLNNGLGNTNNQVQTNTTDIVGLQNQLSTVQSNFVTTADDSNAIHNINSGNVGIGTDLPNEKLDVAGNVKVRQDLIVVGSSMIGNSMVTGNSTVGNNLDVNGLTRINSLKISGGNPALGKVLTSDNNGIATWQTPAAPDLSGYATTTDITNLQQLTVTNNQMQTANLSVLSQNLQDQVLNNQSALTAKENAINKSQDINLGTSDVLFPTQNATKTYVDNKMATMSTVFETTADDSTAIYNTNSGNVGIGTDLPTAKLDVAGDIRIRGGNPAQGKVLTSDNNGIATWQAPISSDLSGFATTTDVTNLQFTVINNQIQTDNLLAQTQYLQNEVLNNQSALTAKEDAINKSQDINLGNSDILFPTQNATKTYVDNKMATMSTVFETTADDANAIHNTNEGNVGIGTDLPSEKLDVNGNLKVRGNVGIGTETPNTSAALEIKSTTGSLLIPRMTTAERNNLTAAEGMIIYNTSDNSYQGVSNSIVNSNPIVDQSQLAIDNAFFAQDKSQSFTAGLSGALTSVRVLLNAMMGQQTATIYIRDGAGNSGAILYQSTAIVSYNDGGNWITINPSSVNLIAGNVYSINIINQGGFDPDSTIDWLCRIDVDNYSGGNRFVDGVAYGGDGVFETTVTPSPTGSLQWKNFLNASTASAGATGPIGSSSFQTTADDANAIYNTNAGNVGIGTDLPSEKLDVNGNLKVRNNATVNGNLGIKTTSPVTNFQLNDKVTDDGQFTYDTNTAYLVHPTPTSSTELNDPKTLLLLARQGTNGEAYGAGAAFNLSRYENNGAGSRTRLDFNLANENFMQNSTNVMTLLSNGNVGIGNTAPVEKMEVTGNVKASSFVKTGGTSLQYLMADGSTSTGATGPAGSGSFETTADDANAIHNINTGNVGIGTDLPSEKLDVAGNLKVRNNATVSGNLNVNGIYFGAGAGTTTGSVGIGGGTLSSNIQGTNNIAIGTLALYSNTNGINNIAIGFVALGQNTTGTLNTAIGSGALGLNTEGSFNTATAADALAFNTTGENNTANGIYALKYNTVGNNNSANGKGALFLNTTGSNNTADGVNTLISNTTGSNNTALGFNANVASDNLANATAIGNGALVDASNIIQLGNTDVTSVNTSGTYTGAGFKTPNGTATEFLMADGSVSTGSTGGSNATVTLAAIGTSSNANGGTIEAGVLNLQPANASFGGVVTTGAQTFAGTKTFTNSLNVDSGTTGGATLQVNGAATNTTAFNAVASLTIDFTKSNLAYTTASAGAFTLSGMKDGGTYTLAVQGATAGTASFSQTGFAFKSISNGTTTASKHTIYTFIVLGYVVYFSMATGF